MRLVNDTGLAWKNVPNFKIRSHKDVDNFLMEMVVSKKYSFRLIDDAEQVEYTIQKDKTTLFTWGFGIREGNLNDPFNPVMMGEIYIDDLVKFIYKYRKVFNEYMFNRED